ncbi:MAG: hypothetical protein LKK54_08115 [Ancrocorticia sp.]|jgi:hypothetical protein|nr:hypothetical protein [Ancrocorticia sp.]MCI2194333.1 hypothetical protein [Ancrocorticia sp.]MCI2199668.1 hypothetical protein [Ancrocorticia sp.]
MKSRNTEPSLEQRLAPSVDPHWAEDFIVELRIEGVAGSAIGAALAEVESHVAESGETAHEAFGDPVVYARTLELPPDPRQSATRIVGYVSTTIVQVVGMFITLLAFPWSSSTVAVSLGNLIAALVIVLAMLGLTWFLIYHMNVFVEHTALSSLLAGLYAAAIVTISAGAHYLWGGHAILAMSHAAVLVIGLALLAGGVAAAVAIRRRDGIDRITRPEEARPITGPEEAGPIIGPQKEAPQQHAQQETLQQHAHSFWQRTRSLWEAAFIPIITVILTVAIQLFA